MSLFITSLNSGSNGNCYYVGDDKDAILIDAGLSCRETEKRMNRCGLSMSSVRAIFISHEHTDHIFGLTVLSKKYQLPVYITDRTRLNSRLQLQPHFVQSFRAYEPIQIGNLFIHPFPKIHDAADPHSFIVSSLSVKVGIFTDIGNACNHVVDSFMQCNAVFLESNYDEALLKNGRYPYHLKQRICGGKGHLSNSQAFQLFAAHRSPFMSHLLLSHLSKENNSPEIVHELFQPYARQTQVIVASRYVETPVFEVRGTPAAAIIPPFRQRKAQVQLSLF